MRKHLRALALFIPTLFVWPLPAFAQPSCTVVNDTIYSVGVSTPILMTGTIDVALGYSAGDGVFVVTQSAARQRIVAGALNTCLAPGNYSAQYSVIKPAPLTGSTSFTRYWTVPMSGGPYTLSAVETSTPVTPVLAVAISQLTNGGATDGQCLAWSASAGAWVPATCGSGGGGGSPGGSTNAVQYKSGSSTFGGVINTTATRQFLLQVSSGVPQWSTFLLSDLPLSAWTGSTAITTLGTVTTGTWNASVIALAYLPTIPFSKTTGVAAAGASTTVYGSACALGGSCTPTLPNPSASTLGGIESITSAAHNWIAYIDTFGMAHQSQPDYSDLTGTPSLPTFPSGAIVGTTDTQTLTNKTLDGVSPATMAFLDPTSSVQTQLNGKAGSGASTTVYGSTCALGGSCTPTLPNPSATTLGGIESITSAAHNWIGYIDTSGVPHQSQPAFSDISGSVAAGQLPNPSATTLGGIESITSAAHNWIAYIDTLGVPHQSQPGYSDISGTPTLPTFPSGAIVGTTDTQTLTNKTLDGVSPATMAFVDPTSSIQTQLNGKAASGASTTVYGSTCSLGGSCTPTLPNPAAATLGGIESITSAAHNWIGYIDTSGVPHQSQPAFTDVSGSLGHSQLPTLLPGDIPNNAANTTGSASQIGGITVSGTPSVGYLPIATSSSAATWQAPGSITGATFITINGYFATNVYQPGFPAFELFTIPFAATYGHLSFDIGTASGTSCTGGTCGLTAEVWSANSGGTAPVAKLCHITNLLSGGTPNLNATGWTQAAFSTSCTLPAGTYYILSYSDSAVLGLPQSSAPGAVSPRMVGYCGNPATGDGASLALAATCGTQTGNYQNYLFQFALEP